MKAVLKSVVAGLIALIMTASTAFAQEHAPYSQAELDQMLAPVALYPDALLSQVLMAATYPLEVVQAARWSRANSQFRGEAAVRAVDAMDWDPSVKSLVAFPEVLQRMDEYLDWTRRLGDAFIAQEMQVIETVQGLRRRAAAEGHLNNSNEMQVIRQADDILIAPSSPQLVHVPYYDPAVVYGTWWWPAYPPVFWVPWPGYTVYSAYAPAFFWSGGVVISTGFFFGHFDWPRRIVRVTHRQVVVDPHGKGSHHVWVKTEHRPARWQHDPHHRKDVARRAAVPHIAPVAPLAPTGGKQRTRSQANAPRSAHPVLRPAVSPAPPPARALTRTNPAAVLPPIAPQLRAPARRRIAGPGSVAQRTASVSRRVARTGTVVPAPARSAFAQPGQGPRRGRAAAPSRVLTPATIGTPLRSVGNASRYPGAGVRASAPAPRGNFSNHRFNRAPRR